MQGLTTGASGRLWAEAINFACDIGNMSQTVSTEGEIAPYEKWDGKAPSLNWLQPFGTVGCMCMPTHEHKLAPRGHQCIMVGIHHNYPSDTV